NGKWTGFQGNTYDNVACNDPAVQDAISQANIAKTDGNGDDLPDIIVFTIAIGDDFNPDSMRAMASDPVDEHYYRVTDAASMASIYNQIANRVQQIGEETCHIYTTYPFANGAALTIRKPDGTSVNVTTTSQGEFLLRNVPVGTYTITSATVTVDGFTYDVFTDGVGGPDLGSAPTVVVGDATTTYSTEIALRTNDGVSCPSP
ncbi:MAG TPA: hypothetical protein VFD70_03600, partial [Anaerolineae bacterium]|nr:hypothetical protein [Anaerolineae bacterium]